MASDTADRPSAPLEATGTTMACAFRTAAPPTRSKCPLFRGAVTNVPPAPTLKP